jgi:hypothetical protein
MMTEEIKSSIPSYYTEEEKKEIIILLTDLANIYLEIEKEE